MKLPIISSPLIERDEFGNVSISSVFDEAQLYYTLDDTEPTKNSIRYTGSFTQILPVKIKAIAFEGNNSSSISESSLTQLKVIEPIITPVGIHFDKELKITINSPMKNVDIRYTLDGSIPSINSKLYDEPFAITNTLNLNVKSFKKNHVPSDIVSAKYELVKISSGVNYKYYVGSWGSTPNYVDLIADSTGILKQFRLSEVNSTENFYALLMFAEISIQKEGEYTFYSGSNDGTKLYIDSKLLVDNDGGHGYFEKSGNMYLEKGKHLIEVRYFQQGGGQELIVSWQGPGFEKREMTENDLAWK